MLTQSEKKSKLCAYLIKYLYLKKIEEKLYGFTGKKKYECEPFRILS